jgi:hypothetical protein
VVVCSSEWFAVVESGCVRYGVLSVVAVSCLRYGVVAYSREWLSAVGSGYLR